LKEGEFLFKDLVLSRFDVTVGPKLYLNVPKLHSQVFLEHIPLLMDFYDKGFFIHEFGQIKSYNLIFTVPSPVARGEIETLMISIIIRNEEDVDPKILQDLLEQFVHELTKIKDVYKGFYKEEKIFEDSHQIYIKIEELLNSVYNSFPKETIFMKVRDINLVMFNYFEEDKSRIVKILRKFISKGQFYKDKFEESNLLFSKISIFEYSISISNPLKFDEFLMVQLKNKNGFIFVVDVTNEILFKIAEFTLELLFKLPEFVFTPSLILIDKIGIDNLEIHNFIKNLRIDEDENKSIKYITINASDNEEIREAINWIVERIAIIKAQVASSKM
jgi:hypothetical protein